MLDPQNDEQTEQTLKEYKRVIAFLEANRTALEAKGLNVDEKLAQTKADLAEFERLCQAADQAEQGYLQATADLADKERDVFLEASKMVDQLLETNPDDPRVQKIARERDQWRKLFPKE